MNEPNPQQEPSMEEILASIRKIISDDDEPQDAAANGNVQEEDVLELTEEVNKMETVAEFPEMPPAADPQPEPAFDPPAPDPEPATPVASLDQSLISTGTAQSAENSLSALAAAVEQEGSSAMTLGVGGRTLEDLVKEVMRPMIREWLDANLPGMVERLVGREIDRMARRSEDR